MSALLEAWARYGERPALIWRDRPYGYRWLGEQTAALTAELRDGRRPGAGQVVALAADYSPMSVAWLLALLECRAVVAPLTAAFEAQRPELYALGEVELEVALDANDQATTRSLQPELRQPILQKLKREGRSGLLLYSSGSAGKIKAVVHDGARFLGKYRTPRRPYVTIPFMLFDHVGGLNTLLHTLSSGGTVVPVYDRSPAAVAQVIARHRVEVLPTTPTFLNLLLLADHPQEDLSSLKILAFGAERMPAGTLARVREAFPEVELVQNYGLSEVGILKTEAESPGSLWIKLGGDGYRARVRDGLLEIQAETAMLGYLNEESPFTEDGWLRTGDRVEVQGEFLRILGRASDLIIVGGEKVYPAEVEDQIATMPGVIEVVVSGEANAITGNVVKAEVRLSTAESRAEFKERMNQHLGGRLLPYKIPQRVVLSQEPLQTARLKKRVR